MSRFLFTLALIFILSLTVSAQNFPDYPVQSVSKYPNFQTKDGISVALMPVSDVIEQNRYFGTSLNAQGFLPVLVVVENDSKESSVLLQKEQITYQIEGLGQTDSDKKINISTKKGVALMFVPNTFGFLGLKAIKDAYNVKQNIMLKQLQSKTIPPGKTYSGFLYLPVGQSGSEKRKLTVNIKFSFDDKQEDTNINFELEIPKDQK